MATTEQYAKWCQMLIEGNDEVVDEILEALYDDGYTDIHQEWIYDDDEDDE